MGLEGKNTSLWVDSAPETDYPVLKPGLHVDVAVLGGGIAGLTTALLLKRDGASVAVVEAGRVGGGVTAYTTAKVTSLHGIQYHPVASSFGDDGARAYAEANEAGLEQVAAFVDELKIDCDFRRKPAFTYAEDDSDRDTIEKELDAAQRAGLDAHFTPETDLPWPVAAAVRVDDQAEYHPRRYLIALAKAVAGRGAHAVEQSRAAARRGGVRAEPRDRRRGRQGARAHLDQCRRADRRPGRGGHALPLPRPRRLLRPHASRALVWPRALPATRCQGPAGDVPLDRVAHAHRALAPDRDGRDGDRRRRVAQDGAGRGPRRAGRAARGVGARALRRALDRVPLVDAGQHAGRRRPVHRPARPVPEAAVGGDRLHEGGPHERDGGRDDPHRPDRRPRQPVGVAVRLDPLQAACVRLRVREGERERRHALRRRPPRAARRALGRLDRARRGGLRAPRRRQGRGLPRRGRHAARRLGGVHPPRLPGAVELCGALVGLPVPRLALRRDRPGDPGPGGEGSRTEGGLALLRDAA